jgi:hypoxanthine phosphoribosyltransferase
LGDKGGVLELLRAAEALLSQEQIQQRVKELGQEITNDYQGRNPLLVGILKGALVFVADIIRQISLPVQIDFMGVTSYGSSTRTSGVVRILKDLDEDIHERDVILVEDILDTGLTLNYLLRNLRSRKPASLEICSLLVKRGKQKTPVKPRYVGFYIEDQFVVGYGLDVNEKFRNLPYIAIYKEEPHS